MALITSTNHLHLGIDYNRRVPDLKDLPTATYPLTNRGCFLKLLAGQ